MSANIQLIERIQRLLEASGADQHAAIQGILGWMCLNAGLESAALFQLGGAGTFICTQRFQTNPSDSDRQHAQTISSDAISRMAANGTVLILKTDDFTDKTPPLCSPETLVMVPMQRQGQLVGFLSFGQQNSDPVVADDKLRLLTSMSGLITSALAQCAPAKDHTAVTAPDFPNGEPLDAILPADYPGISPPHLGKAVASGTFSSPPHLPDPSGVPHDFELTSIGNSTGSLPEQPNAIFVIRDTTAESRLREELRHLDQIVQVMDNLVVITDAEGRVTWANTAFERQSGWWLDEIRGKVLGASMRCPESDPDVIAQVSDAIAQRKTFKGEIINQDRYGNRYWIDFHIWPLVEEDGELRGYVSVETVISRLKEQEAAMRDLATEAEAAQTRLENALMALPDGVVVLDAEERVIAVNGAYHRTFPELAEIAVPGVKLTDLLRAGLSKRLFAGAVTEGKQEAELQKRLAQYRQQKYVDEVQLPNGKWLRRISTRTSDGGCIAIGIDITANKKHLAALDAVNSDLVNALNDRNAARQRLVRIMDGAGIGTWEWNVIDDTLKVGGRWGEIIGLDTQAISTLSFAEFGSFVHLDDIKKMDERRSADFSKGSDAIEHEFRMRHRDGHWVWVLSRSHVTDRSADGSVSVIAGVHIDISERKQLEHKLMTSQTYLSQVMEINVAAIAVMSADDVLTFANAEAQRVLGLERSHKSARGYSFPTWQLESIEGGPLPEEDRPFSQAIAAGRSVREIKFAMRCVDGTRRTLTCNAAPLLRSDGQTEVVATFSDITDQVAATARLEEALSQAEEMSRAKSTFLANMSHEIRTPLNGVLGMAEVLDSLLVEPSQRRMIATIRKSGDTLLTVLNGILDMSKIEAGKMALEEVPFVPVEIARQLEVIYSIQAEEKGLYFEVLSSVGCEKFRLGDSHRIQQILNNLLNNAIKFTEEGGVRMKLSCRPGKPLIIDISDTGIGMDEQQVSRVFESFEQADGSTTRRFGGTGLGLSIVRQLVKLMQGEISVSTKSGSGTKIRVTLPLAECDAVTPISGIEPNPAFAPNALAGVRLLYADDNPVNLLVLREMLARSGAIITEVENGQQAVDAWAAALARNEGFALLLLDITMPVRDGLSALAEIRATEAANGLNRVPALAITANAMAGQVSDYIVGGFTAHLAKPFKRSELFKAILPLLPREEQLAQSQAHIGKRQP